MTYMWSGKPSKIVRRYIHTLWAGSRAMPQRRVEVQMYTTEGKEYHKDNVSEDIFFRYAVKVPS